MLRIVLTEGVSERSCMFGNGRVMAQDCNREAESKATYLADPNPTVIGNLLWDETMLTDSRIGR